MDSKSAWTLDLWHAPAPPDGQRRLMKHEVGFLARQADFECVLLAQFGMSVKTIAQFTGLSANQVHYRLAKLDLSITDFRKGQGPYAQMVFNYLGKRAAKLATTELRARMSDTSNGSKGAVLRQALRPAQGAPHQPSTINHQPSRRHG